MKRIDLRTRKVYNGNCGQQEKGIMGKGKSTTTPARGQAVMAGVPIYTVSNWLGHASITTTQVYAHLAPQHDLMDRLG